MEKRGLLLRVSVLVLAVMLLLVVSLVLGACPHGVTICGKNYNCGVSDNVCPETFGANCTDPLCYRSDSDCGATCLTAGAGAIGNADCKANDINKPICCGNPGAGACKACCPGVICNATFAPAAAPRAQYNTNGDYSCQANCSAVPACNVAANCINCTKVYNGWYNTSTTQWINSTNNNCTLQQQKRQEYWLYTASGTICVPSVMTSTRWVNVTVNISNKAAGTVCGVYATECRLNNTCNAVGTCVPNYRLSTYVCRPAVSICDVAENCTGSSSNCPANAFVPALTSCNSTFRCTSGAGDNSYNFGGGATPCKGYCDGFGSCDWASSCNPSCVSTGCIDSDLANNRLLRGNISLAGSGCSGGVCGSGSVIWDSCSGTSVQDVTCSGPSQGGTLSYDCNGYDTTSCGVCTVTLSNLNQVCDDWGCNAGIGICYDTGSDAITASWACTAARENTSQLCPTTGGIPISYKCYRANAGGWNWSSGALPPETNCTDGYDNNLNGQWDYDSSSPPPHHGDPNCRVGVIPPPETPASVTPSQVFSANVSATVQANSINARINGVECKFSKWNALKAVFNCTAPATSGLYPVLFYINTSKSFPLGGNVTSNNINVVAGSCTGLSQGNCGAPFSPACEWCINCSGRKGNSDPVLSRCVDLGDCITFRGCYAGQCFPDTCDLSGGCGSTCTGDIVNNFNCDMGSCSCVAAPGENCNLKNCSTNQDCVGLGTSTLNFVGDHYTCSLATGTAACGTIGTITCNSSLCTAVGQTWNCKGKTYYCVSNNSITVWNDTITTTEICNDNIDNNGDAKKDCQDTISCPPDSNPNCCNVTWYADLTTSPADNGLGYGPALFDASGNLGTPPDCCGNNANEWYWNIGGGACCDQSTDCVDDTGACFNTNTPLPEAHQQHCINHIWYPCNSTNHTNGEQRGTYNCTFDAGSGGWGWRTNPIPENCTDNIDNNFDGDKDCNDTACIGNCNYNCSLPEGITFSGTCNDGIDNDCDNKTDAKEGGIICPEGSSNATDNLARCCVLASGSLEGTDNDGDTLLDIDDDGCCDLCIARGGVFDTNTGTACGASGCDCGSVAIPAASWDIGTTPGCCGNNTNEYFMSNPSDPSLVACCNSSGKCVDDAGKCQAGVEETEALCSDGIDNDCDGLIDCYDTNCTGIIRGTIRDETNKAVSGAVIRSSPPGKSQECERSATSLSDGSYTLNAGIGSYNIIARKPGFDDNVTWVTVLSKQAEPTGHVVNFNLRNGTCHADCTDSYGYCNPACDGLSFNNATSNCSIAPGCANRPKGFSASEISGTTVTEYTCCEGQPTRTYPVKKARVSGNMENLYVYKTVVKLGLKYVTLNIAYGYPVQ